MEKNQTLTIAPADWGDACAGILRACFAEDRALLEVGRQVVQGRALLFAAETGGEIVGAFVLRVDGDEGVIVAAAGHLDGVSLIPALLSHIESKFTGCRAIRFHTDNPAMARVMSRYGYAGQEVVLRKDL